MNSMGTRARSGAARWIVVGLLLALVGCGQAPEPRFRLNVEDVMANLKLKPDEQATAFLFTVRDQSRLEDLTAEIEKQNEEIAELGEPTEDADKEKLQGLQDKKQELDKEAAPLRAKQERVDGLQTVANALTAAFGTPDDPYVFPESGLDMKKVLLASGSPTQPKAGQRGLFRLQCAHCHGITGDGAGPTAAFLNPYPRDYRQGIFKFKSTQFSAKPTRDDLKRTLIEGIPGTAMPSFMLLPAEEIDALVEYVKYLSMRGQAEILMNYDMLVAGNPFEPTKSVITTDYITPVAETWAAAESQIIVPKDAPEPSDIPSPESVAAGDKLFHGERAACTKCHGPTGLGDPEDVYYDTWNEKKLAGDIFWLLPKQQIKPRNLRLGIYRGGRRPLDLYRRVYAGIPGTPMPGLGSGAGAAAPAPAAGTGQKLSDKEIWDLVNYVRSLPYDEATGRVRRPTGPVAQAEH